MAEAGEASSGVQNGRSSSGNGFRSAAETLTCHRSGCSDSLTTKDARVQVKAPLLAKERLQVNWCADGQAKMHKHCWMILVAAAKGAGDADLPKLIKEERDMILEANKTAEYFDDSTKIAAEAARVARVLRASTHCIAFTGAGISTAAGIGDFRGPTGKWTENDRTKKHGVTGKKSKRAFPSNRDSLRPTLTHEVLAKLMESGVLKYLISQNTDGLHRLSGIPRDKISELHGNGYHERCEKCKTRYERPTTVRNAKIDDKDKKKCKHCRINHRTGRRCEKLGCDGYLMNTIINFGDNLESEVLDRAETEAGRNDLCLCLGTTLRVTPACDLVEMGNPLRLVICNRQPTPFDEVCSSTLRGGEVAGSRVFGDCDDFMLELLAALEGEEAAEEFVRARPDRIQRYDSIRQS